MLHLPHIQISRKIEREGKVLYLELGKYWEIRLTHAFRENQGHGGPPYNKENKGFTRHIKNGHIIPSWYGFSYHDFDTDTYSYMPIPINLIYAVLRWAKYKLLWRVRIEWPHHLMLWEKRIYRLGQIDGYDAGRFTHTLVEGDDLVSAVRSYFANGPMPENIALALEKNDTMIANSDTKRMLEGVDPTTNPGWSKYKI